MLDKEQKMAVTNSYDKNTFLIASAGGGKTRVLTSRVAYIINNGLAMPDEIMVLTFTTKAAEEMLERIKQEDTNIDGITCGTFHSVFLKLLKNKCSLLGLESFNILNDYSKFNIIKEILDDNNISRDKEEIKEYSNKISNFKSDLIHPSLAKSNANSDEENFIADLYNLYQAKCFEFSLLDFDDMLVYTFVLLSEHEDLLEELKDKYKYILVDEAQDCNTAQITILQLLQHKGNNIFLVGDDKQSIYRFRQAKPDFMINYNKTFPNSKMMFLTTNYRSTGNIVNGANSLISHNKNQVKVEAKANRQLGYKIFSVRLDTQEMECDFVAKKIINLVETNNLAYKDISIIYRNNYISQSFENILSSYNIPYVLTKGTPFWRRKEIQDILCFYSLINNPYDEKAITRILSNVKNIGKKSIKTIVDTAKSNDCSFIDILPYCKSRNDAALNRIYMILTSGLNVCALGEKIVNDMEMKEKYINLDTEEANNRLNNIGEFISILYKKNFESIDDFFDFTSINSEEDYTKDKEAVQLLSIHSSKGLEFRVVFLVCMEEGILPSKRSKTDEDIEDERRLAYVGMTRAKDLLFLTSSKKRLCFEKEVSTMPSRFISEINEKYIRFN